MIKITFCLHRLPHLSLEEFQHYWRTNHAPLVASVKEPLRIRRYVQTHRLDHAQLNDGIRASRDAPEPYDGVAELWWDSVDDLLDIPNRKDARDAGRLLLEDEMKFIDLKRSPLWYNQEHEIIPLVSKQPA